MLYWGGLADLVLLVLSASLHLALREPLEARPKDSGETSGRWERLERLLMVRSHLLLATAWLRLASVLFLVWIINEILTKWLAPDSAWVLPLALAVTMLLTMVFGVAIPRAWAKYRGERLVLFFVPLLWAARAVFYPFIKAAGVFDLLVRRLAGIPDDQVSGPADEVERGILRVVSEGQRQGAVDEQEREMIESVIDLRNTRVDEIMTPRTEVVGVPIGAKLDEVRTLVRTHGHSRMPVYEDTVDRIQGVLYAKDLLLLEDGAPFDVQHVMRPPLFVPETKLIRDLLGEFQQKKVHMAVVLDEYGGTAGIATIEDILEELVGEIADEYEEPEPAPLSKLDERTYEVDARMRIDDLNDELGLGLPESEHYETLGGYVSSSLGHIPQVGETCRPGELCIDVVAAEPRKVQRLRITLPPRGNGDGRG